MSTAPSSVESLSETTSTLEALAVGGAAARVARDRRLELGRAPASPADVESDDEGSVYSDVTLRSYGSRSGVTETASAPSHEGIGLRRLLPLWPSVKSMSTSVRSDLYEWKARHWCPVQVSDKLASEAWDAVASPSHDATVDDLVRMVQRVSQQGLLQAVRLARAQKRKPELDEKLLPNMVLCSSLTSLQEYVLSIRYWYNALSESDGKKWAEMPLKSLDKEQPDIPASIEVDQHVADSFSYFALPLFQDLFCKRWRHVVQHLVGHVKVTMTTSFLDDALALPDPASLTFEELRTLWEQCSASKSNHMSGIEADMLLKRALFKTFTDTSKVTSKLKAIRSAAHLYTISLDILERFQMERWCKMYSLFTHTELVPVLKIFHALERSQKCLMSLLPTLQLFKTLPFSILELIISNFSVHDALSLVDVLQKKKCPDAIKVSRRQFIVNIAEFIREILSSPVHNATATSGSH